MTTQEMLARLKNLAKDRGVNLYEMLSLARNVMDDKDWIDQLFKGDAWKAAQYLEEKFFHDLSVDVLGGYAFYFASVSE